jgi:hypothetical protein
MDLRTEYGIEMLNLFRHAVYRKTQVGQLLLLEVQASQLEAGIQTPLLENPGLYLPYLTPNWVLSMRQFMYNHNITITLTQTLQLTAASTRDAFIMSQLGKCGYTVEQQKDINRVRIYLQVTTLADLTDTHTPNKITLWGLTATRPPLFSTNESWPRQSKPSASQRRLWRRYISSQFLRYGRYWRQSQRPNSITGSDHVRHSSSIPYDDLSSLIHSLPKGKRRLLSHHRQMASDSTIWKACRSKHSITIASDGGLKGKNGTFGWQMRSASDEHLAEGAGPVDGPFDTANSTRCELAGYAASILFLSLFQQLWGCRHKCKIRWVTDSKSAIAKVTHHQHVSPSRRHKQPDNSDLLTIIQEGTTCTKRRITPIWIKGHQSTPITARGRRHQDILSNNNADGLATWYREASGKRQSIAQTDHVSGTNISLSINGIRIVGHVASCIRYHINGYHLRRYIQSRNRWSDKTWNRIDIEGMGRFQSLLSPTEQIAHTKYKFDQWYTGTRRLKVSKFEDHRIGQCPCCKRILETTSHLLQCRENPSRESCLQSLRTSLKFNTFNPALQVFSTRIFAWLNDEEMNEVDLDEYPTKFRLGLQQALTDQADIGWDFALKGYLSIEWRYLFTLGIGDAETFPDVIGMQRFRAVVQSLNAFAMNIWKSRNQVLHGISTASGYLLRQEELAEIRDMYLQQEGLLASDRHYCAQSLEDIINKAPSSRRRWLRFMRMARARYTRDGQRQTLITSYFR